MKAVLKFFIVVIFIFSLILFGVGLLVHTSFKGTMEGMLEETVGTPVKMDSAVLDILNSKIILKGIEFSNPQDFPNSPIAKFPKMVIDFEMESFRVKRILMNHVEVNAKELHILRDSEGRFNWFHIKSFLSEDQMFERTGFLALMNDWPLEIEKFTLHLGQAVYTDFSRPVPFKRVVPLNLEAAEYRDLPSMMEMVKILAWEALIRVDQGELQEAFDLVEAKVESKLGPRKEFLARWHEEKKTGVVIQEAIEKKEELSKQSSKETAAVVEPDIPTPSQVIAFISSLIGQYSPD